MNINIYVYLMFFVIPLVLPSRKAIIFSTISVLILCIAWFLLAAFSGLAMSMSGYVFPFFYLAGMIAGGLVRLITGQLAKPRDRPAYFAGIAVAGFVLSVILVNGPSATYQWATIKSLDQCRAASFPVTIGDQKLSLPGQLLANPSPTGMPAFVLDHDYKINLLSFQQWCSKMLNKEITADDVKLTINFRNDGHSSKCEALENDQISRLCEIHRAWRSHNIEGHMSAVIFSRKWEYPELRTNVVGHKPADYPASFNTEYALNCAPDSFTHCEAYGTMGSDLFYVIDFRARQGEQRAEGLRNVNAIKDVLTKLSAPD